ncbi:MAG TPA: 4Fe-4S dicluster domain-containing protein [Anaerolineales bacterium]
MATIQQHAYLFDATRCIDCRACMIACSVENSVPMNDSYIWVTGSAVMGEYPDLRRATMPYHCMHCLEPDCVSACPVGAWSKREDGPVLYDEDKCIGCRYCMNACPFSVPHFDWDKGLFGGALMHKCTMCVQRLEVGQEPACVQTCPTEALKFGEREALIAEAHSRIAAHPERYIDHVYGELENGGTSYLILSHVPFGELGLPDVGVTPVKNVSEAAMRATIPLALGWGAVLTGVTVGMELNKQRKDKAGKEEPAEVEAAAGGKR